MDISSTKKALIVGFKSQDDSFEDIQCLLEELKLLANNLFIDVKKSVVINLKKPSSSFFIGKGKAFEIASLAKENGCNIIIFDKTISPSQQRNWEKQFDICVIDRQEVILDIFAQRASTKEAFIQVSLAKYEYSLPRLKRAWTHLSRQSGGAVNQKGEGESQLELDQRIVREKISKLKRRLKEIQKQRDQSRKKRLRLPQTTCAIVGYTNAGKSSLINSLANLNELVEDKLFATLSTKTASVILPSGSKLLLTDTVGFVRKLPHHLVESFKATLEEAKFSDFILIVADASSPDVFEHIKTVKDVLKDIKCDDKKIIFAFNKIDKVSDDLHIASLKCKEPNCVFLSAKNKINLDELLHCLDNLCQDKNVPLDISLPHNKYDLYSLLRKNAQITKEKFLSKSIKISCYLPTSLVSTFQEYKIKK